MPALVVSDETSLYYTEIKEKIVSYAQRKGGIMVQQIPILFSILVLWGRMYLNPAGESPYPT